MQHCSKCVPAATAPPLATAAEDIILAASVLATGPTAEKPMYFSPRTTAPLAIAGATTATAPTDATASAQEVIVIVSDLDFLYDSLESKP